jgi:excisionase family DNA binding protein
MKAITSSEARQRELLRITEVAQLLGESRANVYLRIKNREIPAIQFGKAIRVPAAGLFEIIDRLVVGAKSG